MADYFAIPAPAKINLYLHALGKRSDGYHFLDSLVVFADVCDVLQIKSAKNFALKIEGKFSAAIDPQNNSIWKAADLLNEYVGEKNGCEISLTKNIPVGAGIGGGSSDAAAALIALNKLWQVGLGQTELEKMALKIGADVPACLRRKSLFFGGIGEKIWETELPRLNLLLVNPGIHVSTAEVFRIGIRNFSSPMEKNNFSSQSELTQFLSHTGNDLQENAIKIAPQIAEVLTLISRQAGCLISRMSGSGSTCFGIFESPEYTSQAATKIAEEKKGWWVKPTSLFNG